MVRFPHKVVECLTKLPENVLLEHFPFLYRFIACSIVVSRLKQGTVFQRLDRGGVDIDLV